MKADLYNPITEQFEERGVYAPRVDALDDWNDDLREAGSNLRWIPSPSTPNWHCRCGADTIEECVCDFHEPDIN